MVAMPLRGESAIRPVRIRFQSDQQPRPSHRSRLRRRRDRGEHLARCLVYVDLNMVRARAVTHLRDWPTSGSQDPGETAALSHRRSSGAGRGTRNRRCPASRGAPAMDRGGADKEPAGTRAPLEPQHRGRQPRLRRPGGGGPPRARSTPQHRFDRRHLRDPRDRRCLRRDLTRKSDG